MRVVLLCIFICIKIELSNTAKLLWQGNFNDNWESEWNIDKPGNFGQERRVSIPDPFGYFTDNVLQVTYPKNTYYTNSGTGFFARPFGSIHKNTTLCLQYYVAFASNFQWVYGGKLPGLFGNMDISDDNTTCYSTQKPHGNDCWNTRMMWRQMGAGEVYGYILQPTEGSNNCTNNNTAYPSSQQYCTIDCDAGNGVSIGRGMFYLHSVADPYFNMNNKTIWNQITQQVTMNTPGDINGLIDVWYNGRHRISFNQMEYRTSPSLQISGIAFTTFFGGTSSKFSTPVETNAYFANFSLFDNCFNNMEPKPLCDFDCNQRGECIANNKCQCNSIDITGDLCSCQYCNKYNISIQTVIKKCWVTGWILDLNVTNYNPLKIYSIDFSLDFPNNLSLIEGYNGLIYDQTNSTMYKANFTHTITTNHQFTAVKTIPELNPLVIVNNVIFGL